MFDKLCVEKMKNGEKTVTRRFGQLRKYYKENPEHIGVDVFGVPLADNYINPCFKGQVYPVKIDRTKNTYGYVKILSIKREQVLNIWHMSDDEANLEGFRNSEEYMEHFKQWNGKDSLTNPLPLIWRIEFEYMEEELC